MLLPAVIGLPIAAGAQQVQAPLGATAGNPQSAPVSANAPPRLENHRVVIDGRTDEEAWSRAWAVPVFFQLAPNEGNPPSESTDLRIFYDDEAIFVSARVHESNPAAVVDRYFERDAYYRSNQDGIGIILNADGDPRTANGFIVTPSGGRTDVAVFDNGQPGYNSDWDAFWDAEVEKSDDGWSVEMRIPFSSVRFQPDSIGNVQVGLVAWRYLARNDEYDVFPRIPNNWGRNSAYKVTMAQALDFKGITTHRPLYIKPYLLGGTQRRGQADANTHAWATNSNSQHEVGGDLKLNLTNTLILDVTANTDFAQVEADDEIINLDRFSVFFPEKREFFQERADLFEFNVPGAQDGLFHSRTIGIANGQPIPIRGGARLTGNLAGWDVGLIDVQTGAATVNGLDVRSENFGVVRAQHPVGKRGTYMGGLVTSRTDFEGARNLVYGLDADVNVGRGYYLDAKAAQSLTTGRDAMSSILVSAFFQRRINRGFRSATSFRYIGSDFYPAVGFMSRTGYNRAAQVNGYTWFPANTSAIQSHGVDSRIEFVWDEGFHKIQTRIERLNWNFNFRNASSAGTEWNWIKDVPDKPFRVGTVTIPAGEYQFATGMVRWGSPSGRPLQFGTQLVAGGYYGGNRRTGSVTVNWNPGPLLSLGAESSYNQIDVPAGSYDVVISRVRLGTALSRTVTAAAYIQHHSGDRTLSPNVRIRYNPREGSDLYLVYNERINTSLDPEQPDFPDLLRSQSRSVQLKYTYTFVR